MRTLILTAAVLIAGLSMSDQVAAADRSHHQPSMSHNSGSHGATITLAAHHGSSRHGYGSYGRSRHGYGSYGHGYSSHGYSRHGHLPYRYHGPSYHRGCYPPVIVRPPVAVPYYGSPYGYNRGYGYYHGGVRVNTGRVGVSIGF